MTIEQTEKKALQQEYNFMVEDIFAEMVKEYDEKANKEYPNKWSKPLRSCQAEVYETEHFYILRSYHTIVACIDKRTNYAYDFLRMVYGYTSTSNQHICKFISDYGNRQQKVVWRTVD